MDLVILVADTGGGFGLRLTPGTAAWWATRPLWMAVLSGVLFLMLVVVARFERVPGPATPRELPAWRAALGAALVCAGLALIALGGIGDDGPLGVRVGVLALAFVGAFLLRGLPWPVRERDPAT